MKGGVVEKLVSPEPSTHPKLGRKGKTIDTNITNYSTTKSIFRNEIKNDKYLKEYEKIQNNLKIYNDKSCQTDITCFKKKQKNVQEMYMNYKLYFSNYNYTNTNSNIEPNFMKETENKKYRNYLNKSNLVDNKYNRNETVEMIKFWNPNIYPFTKTKR